MSKYTYRCSECGYVASGLKDIRYHKAREHTKGKITITLTEDQVETLYSIINEEVSKNAFSGQSDYVAFISRIRAKIHKARQLAKAKSS